MKQAKPSTRLIVTLIMMCMAGVFASDIYIPALPEISTQFDVAAAKIQATLSSFLLSLALFQLLYGPLSERYGKRLIALIGSMVFCLASLACALATHYQFLIFARFIQAAGAGSGMVIGIAIVGFFFSEKEAAKIYAIVFPFVALSTALSPIIGGYLTTLLSWRSTFFLTFIFGLILILLVKKLEKDSPNPESNLTPAAILNDYFHIINNTKFICYALISACGYMVYFAYFAESPFIFHSFQLNASEMSYFYSPLALSYMLGNFIAGQILKKRSTRLVIAVGLLIFLGGGLSYPLFISARFFTPITMTISISVMTFANGFFLPTSTASAISQHQKKAGVASAVVGCLQFILAAIAAHLVGFNIMHSAKFFGLMVALLSIAPLLLFIAIQLTSKLKNAYANLD